MKKKLKRHTHHDSENLAMECVGNGVCLDIIFVVAEDQQVLDVRVAGQQNLKEND
jgi:hypothetical protein